jgi:hypothetical protein
MLRRGDYVLCNFPFRESRGPGPSPHVVLCAATGREGNASFAIVFYTTSQTDYRGAQRPRQYLLVSKARAMEMGQKVAFHVDASRIARLPLTTDYFPELGDKTVRAIGRDPGFVIKVEQRLRELIAAGFKIAKVDLVQDRQIRPR